METENYLFTLLRTAITGEQASFELCTTEAELEQVYSLARKHDLTHLAAHALEKMELPQWEILSKFKTAKMQAIYRFARMDYEFEQVCKILEEAQIPFLPLKGAVLRQLYPEPWMRTSCDIDILVKDTDLKCAVDRLLEKNWHIQGEVNYHDISLFSSSGVHLELHFHIKENIPQIDPVLQQVWQYSEPVKGKMYEHRMKSEFFLFHQLAHMAYHFIVGGCGIRPFMDLWILRSSVCEKNDWFLRLCKEADLERFCQGVEDMVDVWFEGKAHTFQTQQMEQYILEGGLFGTMSNRIMVGQAMKEKLPGNWLERIFLPYDLLKITYPVLEKHKYLTPVYQVVRWCGKVDRDRMARIVHTSRLQKQGAQYDIQETKQFLENMGLYSEEVNE